MSDDLDLLRAWRSGDTAAGNRLVRRHFPLVYRFFRNKIAEGVEELVQHTFLACVESVDRFRGEGSFKGFLLGIARIQLLRHLRASRPERELCLEEHSIEQITGSPSGIVAFHDQQRVLLQALRRLPLDLQMTVELYYWEELSTSDIGVALGVPAGTVKSRLSRARALLRDMIGSLEQDKNLRETTLQNLDGWARSLRGLIDPERD